MHRSRDRMTGIGGLYRQRGKLYASRGRLGFRAGPDYRIRVRLNIHPTQLLPVSHTLPRLYIAAHIYAISGRRRLRILKRRQDGTGSLIETAVCRPRPYESVALGLDMWSPTRRATNMARYSWPIIASMSARERAGSETGIRVP
jgi:hypothetical protein